MPGVVGGGGISLAVPLWRFSSPPLFPVPQHSSSDGCGKREEGGYGKEKRAGENKTKKERERESHSQQRQRNIPLQPRLQFHLDIQIQPQLQAHRLGLGQARHDGRTGQTTALRRQLAAVAPAPAPVAARVDRRHVGSGIVELLGARGKGAVLLPLFSREVYGGGGKQGGGGLPGGADQPAGGPCCRRGGRRCRAGARRSWAWRLGWRAGTTWLRIRLGNKRTRKKSFCGSGWYYLGRAGGW